MKICPVAIAVGCPKCPVFRICPAKAAMGGYVEPPAKQANGAAKGRAAKK